MRLTIIPLALCLATLGSASHSSFSSGHYTTSYNTGGYHDSTASGYDAHSDTSSCALIIPGVGKSSSFDHFNSVVGGHADPYSAGQTCITYESIDQAFDRAKGSVGYHSSRSKPDNEDIASLGTAINEASRYLAKQYGLTKDTISNGLPLIDVSKTKIGRYCPAYLMNPKCSPERYRQYDGMCNNLEKPHWGAAKQAFQRFLSSDYADGISVPRVSVTGYELPSPRDVSAAVHHDDGFHDHAVTLMIVAWGQFIDHDITLTAETRNRRTKKAPKCCQGEHHPNCLPITISDRDHFYSLFGEKCMNFVRSLAGLRHECRLGDRVQFNLVTSILDGNTLYGSSNEVEAGLRTYHGGLMKTLPVFQEYGMKDLLPLKLEDPNEGCIRPSEDVYCFLAGDLRVNEQTVLAVTHMLFMREHNRIATELSYINPHWEDETIFQETRHIIAALMQHITYNEFLPMVLGKEVMHSNDLVLQKDGYFKGYDPYVNPSAEYSFITAAFRFGHSLLPSTVERWSKTHRYIGSQRLSEMLQQPYDLYKGGWADQFIFGLINQVAQALDDSVTQEVTNHLFTEPGKRFGMDLTALNMQRAREHGVPSYNYWREFCGLGKISSWSQLRGLMKNDTVAGYSANYHHPDDMDLFTAGISESPLPGSMVGPTFACIIGKQFRNLRYGDRFWYENGGWPSSFTLQQLQEIRKYKLSRLLCDNADDMETVQVYSMVLPDHDINPRVPCKSQVLPHLDLTKWKDAYTSGSGSSQSHHATTYHEPFTYFGK